MKPQSSIKGLSLTRQVEQWLKLAWSRSCSTSRTVEDAPQFTLSSKRQSFEALGLAALLNTILFVCFFAVATPCYDTNDDLLMQMVSSGSYTGHPSEYLVFTNVLIGWVLRILYATWNGPNWYVLYLIGTNYLAVTAISFIVISRRRGWVPILLYLVFFLLFETHLLLKLQFTTTAFVAGSAGVLLLVEGLQQDRAPHWPKVIAGLGLAGLMILIREEVAPLLGLLACPFLIERFRLIGWRRATVTALTIIGLFLCLAGINRWYYQRDRAWREFLVYNELRGKIHMTALQSFIPEVAPAIGWSQNDAYLFAAFYFNDPEVYASVSRMRLLYEKLCAASLEHPAPRRLPKNWFWLPKLFYGDSAIAMNLALLNSLWCVFAAGRQRRRCAVTLVCSFALCWILSVYLSLTARLPDRVTYNMALLINLICLYWAAGFSPQAVDVRRESVFKRPLSALRRAGLLRLPAGAFLPIWITMYVRLVTDVGGNFFFANALHRGEKATSAGVFEPLRTLLPSGKKPVLVVMPSNPILERALCFRRPRQQIPAFLIPYGWLAHSPLFSEVLAQHELHPYSQTLLQRPDVFFFMGKEWIGLLQTYYKEHYSLDVRFDPVLTIAGRPEFPECNLNVFRACSDIATPAYGFGSSPYTYEPLPQTIPVSSTADSLNENAAEECN